MSFYSDQAAWFTQMAADIQTRLSNEGATLDDAAYTNLDRQRDELLDAAGEMIADDIQAALEQLQLDEARLARCTASLSDAVQRIKRFDQIAAVVAAAVTLATAVASANPGAIVSALEGAETAVAAAAPGAGASGLALAASGDEG